MALAALKGDLTLAQLVDKFDVVANQITKWKTQLLGGAGDVFGKGEKRQQQTEEDVTKLHAKIGQLTMENDFLERGLEWIHGPRGKQS